MLNRGWSPFGWQSSTKRVGALPLPGSPAVYLDGDDTDGSANSTRTNGVAFNDWLNKGSLGGTFSQATAGFRPLFATGLLNGHAGATFDGTDDTLMSSVAASSFIFMHDGNGATIYSVVKTSASRVGNIAATSAGASGSVGVIHRYDASFAAQFVHGAGAATRTTITAAAGSVGNGVFDVYATTLASANTPDAGLFVEGASVASGNTLGFSALAPGSALMVGGSVAGTNFLAGDLVCLLVYDVAHDATQRAEVEAFLASKYGVAFPA